jgi:hypothetical protein
MIFVGDHELSENGIKMLSTYWYFQLIGSNIGGVISVDVDNFTVE